MFNLILAFSMMTGIPEHPQYKEIEQQNVIVANIPLAMWLLSSPDPIDYTTVAPIGSKEDLTAAVIKQAIALELLDMSETSWFFKEGSVQPGDEFSFYMDILRERFAELEGAPLASEAEWRLPPAMHLQEMIRYNRAAYYKLERRLIWQNYQQGIIKEVMGETEEFYAYWRLAYEAKCGYCIAERRRAMKQLKDKLSKIRDEKNGPSYWEMHKMPPVIPHWRYSKGDSPVEDTYK